METIGLILVILFLGYALLLAFYTIGWLRTRPFEPKAVSGSTKLSVIIAARNEENNIQVCLESILKNSYPTNSYEIIVVDDHSEDNTFNKASELDDAQLRILQLPEGLTGKKAALNYGIQRATGDLIITTDADCTVGPHWLLAFAAFYEQYQPKVIAGPVAISKEEGFTQVWQSMDLAGLMAITAGSMSNGFPNMANGANLAYEKALFDELEGFKDIDHTPSGDDILFLLKAKKKYRKSIRFLLAPEAVVYTSPLTTWKEVLNQRKRWVSKTGTFQDIRISLILIWSYVFNLAIIITLIGGWLLNPNMISVALGIGMLKMITELPLLQGALAFFDKKHLLIWLVPAQVFHIFYVVYIGFMAAISGFEWKGRTYQK